MARKDIIEQIAKWDLFEKSQMEVEDDTPVEDIVDMMVQTLQQISSMGGEAGALADACLANCPSVLSSAQMKKKKKAAC